MKPLDEERYTLTQVSDAIDKIAKERLGSLAVISKEDLIAELRPKPKFAEGQVVYIEEDVYPYKTYDSNYMQNSDRPQRALDFTELGPEVMALRDAAWKSADKSLLPALKALDAAHGGEK